VGVLRRLAVVALVLLALLGISQLVIPPIAENRVEDRVTAVGGTADVSMSAFPAARLLFGDGSRLTVSGTFPEVRSSGTSATRSSAAARSRFGST
jgi:hypothetical protein